MMMPTERHRLQEYLESSILRSTIGERLAEGATIIYPTETIYGIGGRGNSEGVKSRILAAKKRPLAQPMILIAGSRHVFDALQLAVPQPATRLADAFWPGYLTLVVPGRAEKQFIGIRVSPHRFLRTLAQSCSFPLFSTSANISGDAYVNDPDAIYTQFRNRVDYMIDAGPLPASKPSTVVKINRDNGVEILREGEIAGEDIKRVVAGE
ncbi:MAG: threonylcarbamoyl-AMP synthase [Chitinivibrionales bacterium]|nr:threonylcarbamoyl-AMP synthase [Chitinivibrionales bacterium]